MSDTDFCEISIFSRPETPYYSPFLQRLDYMNAEEAVRTMRRFQVTAANARKEANVYKVGAHTPISSTSHGTAPGRAPCRKLAPRLDGRDLHPLDGDRRAASAGHTFRVNFIRKPRPTRPRNVLLQLVLRRKYPGQALRLRKLSSRNTRRFSLRSASTADRPNSDVSSRRMTRGACGGRGPSSNEF